ANSWGREAWSARQPGGGTRRGGQAVRAAAWSESRHSAQCANGTRGCYVAYLYGHAREVGASALGRVLIGCRGECWLRHAAERGRAADPGTHACAATTADPTAAAAAAGAADRDPRYLRIDDRPAGRPDRAERGGHARVQPGGGGGP